MANMTVSNIDLGSVVIEGGIWNDGILSSAAAHDYLEGTILARQTDALTVTASAVSGGGNGTVTAASVDVGPIVPLVGVYTLTCVAAIANGGKWKLTDPNGEIVADDLEMTVGAGAATVFKVGGLVFTITDGGTDFSAGATATLTVAASGKLVAYSPSGAGGAQKPVGILTYPVSKPSASDITVRVFVRGLVDRKRLVIDADGNDSNITDAILDELRKMGITTDKVTQLSTLDNQ